MSAKAKIKYSERYRGVPIEISYEDTKDLTITSKMKPILARVRELIDFHKNKLEERRRRKFEKPYVGSSWVAISHIQNMMKNAQR